MKLRSLKTRNFLSLDSFDMNFAKPVVLVCGHNEVGKTSIANAVSFALTGLPRRADISKKKDLAHLVTHGKQGGKVLLGVEHDGQSFDYERAVLSGVCTQANVDDPWFQCCLDMHKFSSLSTDERKRLLFGAKPNFQAVASLATSQYKISKTLLDEYRSWIETGFDEALEKLREDVRELKGEWRGVTNEMWGSEKGETWERVVAEPEPVKGGSGAVTGDISITRSEMAALANERVRLKQQIAEIAGKQALLNQLEKEANPDKDFKKLMEDLMHEHVLAEEKAFSNQSVMDGVQACPHCGGAIAVSRKKIIAVQIKGVDSAQAQLKVIEARMEELEAEMQAVKIARERLAKVRDELPDVSPLESKLERVEQDFAVFAEIIEQNKAWIAANEEYKNSQKQGRSATERAKAIHQKIIQRMELGKALSPEAIPEILGAQVFDKINALLVGHAKASGWKPVRFRSDGEIVRDATPYFLLSESAQWRCDAMLTLTLAQLSGWKLAILDRMDVLDLAGRAQALRWLSKAHQSLDTILVMATLKEDPKISADWLQTKWLSAWGPNTPVGR